jgi:hypothetical protein
MLFPVRAVLEIDHSLNVKISPVASIAGQDARRGLLQEAGTLGVRRRSRLRLESAANQLPWWK